MGYGLVIPSRFNYFSKKPADYRLILKVSLKIVTPDLKITCATINAQNMINANNLINIQDFDSISCQGTKLIFMLAGYN